jgi:hypothetical protein
MIVVIGLAPFMLTVLCQAGGPAAIHGDDHSGYEGGAVRGQKGRYLGLLLGLRRAPQRRPAAQFLGDLGPCGQILGAERESRRDRVHPDALGAVLDRERLVIELIPAFAAE